MGGSQGWEVEGKKEWQTEMEDNEKKEKMIMSKEINKAKQVMD